MAGTHHGKNQPLIDTKEATVTPPVPPCTGVTVDEAAGFSSLFAQPYKCLAAPVFVHDVKQVNALADLDRLPLSAISPEKRGLSLMSQTGFFGIELFAIGGYINNSHILLLLPWFCLHRYYNIFVLKVKIFLKNV
jgi:hypothetical protein